jgi:hypothetical protein
VVSSELGPIYRRTVIRAVAGLGEPTELSDGVRGAATHHPVQAASHQGRAVGGASASRKQKFEPIPLQQRVRKLSVPLGDDTLVGCSGAMPCPMITRISATSPAMTVGTMPSGASSLMNRSKNPGVGVRRKLPGDLKAIFESLLSSPLQRRVIAGLRRDQGFAAPSPRLAHAGLRVVHRRLRYTRPEEAKAPLDELR